MSKQNPAKTLHIIIVVGIVALVVGFLSGLLLTKGIEIDHRFTADGAITALATLIAVITATIVLPFAIQPVIKRQSNLVNIAHDDINSLLKLIEDVLNICEKIHHSNKVVTEHQRQLILTRHTDIHSLAKLLKEHSGQLDALRNFDTEVFEPLNDSHTDFSDNVMPNRKLTAPKHLAIRNNLEPITYRLRDMRYYLN